MWTFAPSVISPPSSEQLPTAGPIAGGYYSIEDETEGFEFLHHLKACLVKKLHAPPS